MTLFHTVLSSAHHSSGAPEALVSRLIERGHKPEWMPAAHWLKNLGSTPSILQETFTTVPGEAIIIPELEIEADGPYTFRWTNHRER